MHAPGRWRTIASVFTPALTLTLAVIGLTIPSGRLLASDSVATRLSKQVRVSDIDWSFPDDVARLYRRISHAADEVCAPSPGPSLKQFAVWRACRAEAIRDAVAAVDRATLTSYHLAQGGDRTLQRG